MSTAALRNRLQRLEQAFDGAPNLALLLRDARRRWAALTDGERKAELSERLTVVQLTKPEDGRAYELARAFMRANG